MERVNNIKTFRDYIVRFNPLGIVAKGIGLSFEGYDSCYSYVFDFLYSNCKRGYIDVALLLCELLDFSFPYATELTRKASRRKVVACSYALDFTYLESNNYKELKELFSFLHSIQGTALNVELFDKEYKKFILRLNHRINGNNPT